MSDPVLRNVRMSTELFEAIGRGPNYRLRVDWGEPDDEGFYTPTLTRLEVHKMNLLLGLAIALFAAGVALFVALWAVASLYRMIVG